MSRRRKSNGANAQKKRKAADLKKRQSGSKATGGKAKKSPTPSKAPSLLASPASAGLPSSAAQKFQTIQQGLRGGSEDRTRKVGGGPPWGPPGGSPGGPPRPPTGAETPPEPPENGAGNIPGGDPTLVDKAAEEQERRKRELEEEALTQRMTPEEEVEAGLRYRPLASTARKVQPPERSVEKPPDIVAEKVGKIPDPDVIRIPEGFSTTRPADIIYPEVEPREGNVFIYGPDGERREVPEERLIDDPSLQTQEKGELGQRIEQLDSYDDIGLPTEISLDDLKAVTKEVDEAFARGDIPPGEYEAVLAGELNKFVAPGAKQPGKAIVDEIRALTERAIAAKRDPAQEEAARMEAAKRPEAKDYAEGVTIDERVEIPDRDPEALLDQFKTKYGDISISPPSVDADGNITWFDEAAGKSVVMSPADFAREHELDVGVTTEQRFKIIEAEDPEAYTRIAQTIAAREQQSVIEYVTKEGTDLDKIPEYALAERRTAQVGKAETKIAAELKDVPSLDLKGRAALTKTPPRGDAAQIDGIPTMAAAKMEAVQGGARRTSAADMMSVLANLPTEVTAAIAEEPATVQEQIDSGEDPEVTAAVAALPVEALVSTQMSNLLAGMEEGKTPLWARPAVAQVEQMMAQRGLSVSTVGRDALFNAIIQSALPMAQSNAQALQQRAQQNLSNEQQANLAAAQQTMQIRMQNLANRQTAASQTANMAQQIKVQQGQFRQEAGILSAQQTQQTELANAQLRQQEAQQESAQRQQVVISELDVGSRMDLANLQAESLRAGKDMDANQQARLTTYNAKIAKVMRKADFDQDMEKANLSSELQMEMLNLTEVNAARKDTMTAENQERLTLFNTLVDFKKNNAGFAQQMDLANMSAENQMELAELSERAATDAANMTEANKFRLTRLSTYVNVMSQNTELRQRAEMAQMSVAEKISLSNLTAKNQADAESMSAENIVELQKYEKKMAAGQVNAQLAQQLGLTNLSNKQSAAMFNAQIDANMDIKQFDFNQQASLADSQFMQSMTVKDFNARQTAAMQNATALANLDLSTVDQRTKLSITNANNFLSMDMADLNNRQQGKVIDIQLEQQRLLSDQASTNASRQFKATSENQINQFNTTMANQMEQFNVQQGHAMKQFNASETNRVAAIEAGNELDALKFNNELEFRVDQFNENVDLMRDQWNAANSQAVEQSNILWRRNANTINTAAQNSVNQLNAQMAYNISTAEQSALWQQLRDDATYLRQSYENEEQRKTSLYATALANEGIQGHSTEHMREMRNSYGLMMNTITKTFES